VLQTLSTRTATSESNITKLDQTTKDTATQLSQLKTTVSGNTSSITKLDETAATHTLSLKDLTTDVGGVKSNITTLQETDKGFAADIKQLKADVGAASGSVTSESTVRASSDNVLVQALNTIWGAIGTNSALVQGGSQVTLNTAGAVAEAWQQVQAAIKDTNGNLISSAAIKQTTTALVDKTGKLDATWAVNVDAGGVALGWRQAGFGISGSATEHGPQYAFGVRADQFWVAAPGEDGSNGIPSARVPFVIKTGSWVDSGGVTQPPGVYLNELFATSAKIGVAQIKRGHIEAASVDTLRIGPNAVTVPMYLNGYGPSGITAGSSMRLVGTMQAYFPDTVNIVALVSWDAAASGVGGNTRCELWVDGWMFGACSNSNINGYGLSHSTSAKATLSAGYHTFSIYFGNDWYQGSYDLGSWSCTLLGVMR
jgi:hypothetical protein